ATQLLGECLALLQSNPAAMTDIEPVLGQAARALSILHGLRTRSWMDEGTQPRLLSYSHRGEESAFRFTHDQLPLHRPPRSVVMPAAIAAPVAPGGDEPEPEDDVPLASMAELKGMAASLAAGAELPEDEEPEAPEATLPPLVTHARPSMAPE